MRLDRLFMALLALIVSSVALTGVFPWNSPVQAMPKGVSWPGPFRVQVIAVKDGDTVEVLFREGPCSAGGLGAPCPGSVLALRIRGIDTPEKKLCQKRSNQSCAACPEEAELGKRATAFANAELTGRLAARVTNLGRDPYFGRIVGTIEILKDGRFQNYADLIIAAGLAQPYDPSGSGSYAKLKGWCPRKAG
jgi:endonuclease YncB( thermonuclease family)